MNDDDRSRASEYFLSLKFAVRLKEATNIFILPGNEYSVLNSLFTAFWLMTKN